MRVSELVQLQLLAPTDALPDLYELIARRLRAGGHDLGRKEVAAEAAGDDASIALADGSREWPPDDLRDLYKGSKRRMKAILEALASRPEEKLTTTDFAKAIGEDHPRGTWNVAGVLGAFGRKINEQYGGRLWPFHVDQDEDDGELDYWMPQANADVIVALMEARAVKPA